MGALNLLDLDLDGLATFCDGLGEKRFRAQQLFRWIHHRGEADFARMSDLARTLRDKLPALAMVAAPPCSLNCPAMMHCLRAGY